MDSPFVLCSGASTFYQSGKTFQYICSICYQRQDIFGVILVFPTSVTTSAMDSHIKQQKRCALTCKSCDTFVSVAVKLWQVTWIHSLKEIQVNVALRILSLDGGLCLCPSQCVSREKLSFVLTFNLCAFASYWMLGMVVYACVFAVHMHVWCACAWHSHVSLSFLLQDQLINRLKMPVKCMEIVSSLYSPITACDNTQVQIQPCFKNIKKWNMISPLNLFWKVCFFIFKKIQCK